MSQAFQQHLSAKWNYPTAIHAGPGKLNTLPSFCRSMNIKAPLIVTNPDLAELFFVRHAVNLCQEAGLYCKLFSAIKGNPSGENVYYGVECYQAGKHDSIIALGGGSAIDTGKAIALLSGQTRPLWDFEDSNDNYKRATLEGIAPIIAIPTTAGTGSEVGRIAVITDTKHQIKRMIFHPGLLPQIVILDPELTCALSPSMTAASGMDALSHNLEAYCVPDYHPMAAGIASEGIRLIKNNLYQTVSNGKNIEARMHMLTASMMGGTAAFQRGLGAMHALAHTLGAIYDTHHGLLNAILMPYVLQANKAIIEKSIERLAKYLSITGGFEGFLHWILELRQQTGIPHSLANIEINTKEAERIGTMAVNDRAALTNPLIFTAKEYSQIFSNAVQGNI